MSVTRIKKAPKYKSVKDKHATRIVIIPDVHADYHDRRAVNCALKAIEAFSPDIAINIGDFVDASSMSRHTKDPNKEGSFKKELKKANALLDRFDEALGSCKYKYWTKGNHDEWVEERILENLPGLHGLVDIDTHLGLAERGWEVIPFGKYLSLGKVLYTHASGHYGKHTAMNSLEAVGQCLVYGDTHHAAVVYLGSALGETHVAMNVGWLGDVNYADYMPRHKTNRHWQHGFGIGYMQNDGTTSLHFVPIIGGKCVIPTENLTVAA